LPKLLGNNQVEDLLEFWMSNSQFCQLYLWMWPYM